MNLLGPVFEQGEQRVEVALDVEQADRLAVEAERGPGQDLEELLEGPDAPRAG